MRCLLNQSHLSRAALARVRRVDNGTQRKRLSVQASALPANSSAASVSSRGSGSGSASGHRGDGAESSGRRSWPTTLAHFWHTLLEALIATCLEWEPAVRDSALGALHAVMTRTGRALHLSPDAWGLAWRELLLPMLNEFASAMQVRAPPPAAVAQRRPGLRS